MFIVQQRSYTNCDITHRSEQARATIYFTQFARNESKIIQKEMFEWYAMSCANVFAFNMEWLKLYWEFKSAQLFACRTSS